MNVKHAACPAVCLWRQGSVRQGTDQSLITRRKDELSLKPFSPDDLSTPTKRRMLILTC